MFITLQSILLIVGIILVVLGIKEKENRKISRVLKHLPRSFAII